MVFWKYVSQSLVVAVVLSLVSNSAQAADEFLVDFRLGRWKTRHVDSAQKAAEQEKVLKELGCEVKVRAHAGHHDVSYRCPQWRRLAARSDTDAHRWEEWLKARGFEARHAH